MSHDEHAGAPALPYCRNCHFTLATPRPVYCGHCGQETDLHPPSVREMFTEYLGHYVAFDGPLWRTLWALVCLPGHLTNAYFHGQRRRYVLPLRVYLSASFLFFVGSHLLSHGDAHEAAAAEHARAEAQAEPGKPVRLRVPPGATPAETAAEAARIAASAAGREAPVKVGTQLDGCDSESGGGCAGIEGVVNRLADKASHMTGEQWKARLHALAPYGMLAMQPLFAAVLLGLFAGSGRRYAEHFVFSLHSHSLWFLALLAETLGAPVVLLMLAVFGHGVAAMRRVYRLGWGGALWRGMLLSLVYFAVLLAGLMLMVAAIAATA